MDPHLKSLGLSRSAKDNGDAGLCWDPGQGTGLEFYQGKTRGPQKISSHISRWQVEGLAAEPRDKPQTGRHLPHGNPSHPPALEGRVRRKWKSVLTRLPGELRLKVKYYVPRKLHQQVAWCLPSRPAQRLPWPPTPPPATTCGKGWQSRNVRCGWASLPYRCAQAAADTLPSGTEVVQLAMHFYSS